MACTGAAQLLDAIRRWTQLYGCAPARTDWDPARAAERCEPVTAAAKLERYRSGDWPSAHTVRSRFGSFAAAVHATGVKRPTRRAGMRWSDEAIIDALRDLAHEHDRALRPEDLRAPHRDLPSPELLALRFGDWHGAMAAAGLPTDETVTPGPASNAR